MHNPLVQLRRTEGSLSLVTVVKVSEGVTSGQQVFRKPVGKIKDPPLTGSGSAATEITFLMETQDNTLSRSQQSLFGQSSPTDQEIVRLYKELGSYTRVGKVIGRSRDTVRHRLERAGCPSLGRAWRKGAPTAEMYQYYLTVNSVNKVGERYKMSGSSVAIRFKKDGYELLGAKGKHRICAGCGKPFEATNNHDVYCGDDCKRIGQLQSNKRSHRKRNPLGERVCANPNCPLPGRRFMQDHDVREQYCSDDCKAAANRLRNAETFRAAARRRSARTLPFDLPNMPETWQRIVPVLIADRAAGGNTSNGQVRAMFGLEISKETMNDIRRYCGVSGPKGRPKKACK